MIPFIARFCIACGQILDDLQGADSWPCWIAAHAYREKYGFMFTDLPLIGDACSLCAHVITGRRESLAETLSELNWEW